ncbi:flagellar biosynthetic protein FliO [Devosia oryziradicis]|uniref:Flagellar biosynthetic protein FliO n=1 Tax=Devosia oryziradicis TaxID=2801335 RepID=A0ABX7BRZ0_9HYPH|nr:flagellar biosynthetic protein FliO [Devosia oryziradicis]QQR34681.1 flagellar biosynthetic protein FliO [Devosia oryziradicis]
MQFITSLFGGSGSTLLTALFALGAVIVAILLVLWLLKLVFSASGNAVRGRNRRLAVVDSLALDPKRQLLIIRRDDVEHLILVGGTQDIVVEAGIAIEEAAAAQPQRRPIPMVAGRKPAPAKAQPSAVVAPAPAAPAAATAAPRAAASAAPTTAIEQLRELGLPTNKRAHLSLRHTGLLRPVSETEMPVSPENSPAPVVAASDSAKEETARRDVEGTDLVEDTNEANRN